jgi:tRNA/tmRNA/rRNA uracil-C5-methylase (TrmA/RlmC/RlmD family)
VDAARGATDGSTGSPGDELDLDVTGVAHGGVFVGRLGAEGSEPGRGGRVVFVPDAVPGERVRIRLTDVAKKSFWRADVLEVLEPSPHRRPHIWRQADVGVPPELRPGGADFGHIDLAHQRTLKAEVLADALRRFGGIDVEPAVEPAGGLVPAEGAARSVESADGSGYRTRLSLHVDGEGRIGPFGSRTHTVIPVADHPLATEAVERVALGLTDGRPGRIDLVQPADGRVRVVARPDPQKHAPREARETVIERVGEREFRVDAGGFWQVHRLAAETLDAAVRGAVRDVMGDGGGTALDPAAWHLDLYGGVGLFAAAIAELGGTKVTSVESDPRATEHAGENLAEWVGARAETARVDRFVARVLADATQRERDRLARGVVVLDPPRAGAGGAVVRAISEIGPAAVIYVACDPVALARDVATFRERGYEMRSVRSFDLFPHSHHIEAVAAFTR